MGKKIIGIIVVIIVALAAIWFFWLKKSSYEKYFAWLGVGNGGANSALSTDGAGGSNNTNTTSSIFNGLPPIAHSIYYSSPSALAEYGNYSFQYPAGTKIATDTLATVSATDKNANTVIKRHETILSIAGGTIEINANDCSYYKKCATVSGINIGTDYYNSTAENAVVGNSAAKSANGSVGTSSTTALTNADALTVAFDEIVKTFSVSPDLPPDAPTSSQPISSVRSVLAPIPPSIPTSTQIYTISQKEGVMPKILQVMVNPPDAHPGDVQSFSLITQDDSPIVSVQAFIRTDHSTTTVSLADSGPAPATSLAPMRYYADASGRVLAVDPALVAEESAAASASNGSAEPGGILSLLPTPIAHAEENPKESYKGSWTVKDTHVTSYDTVFVVKDADGRVNDVKISWLDPCSYSGSTLSSNCSVSAVDGFDGGSLTISNANLTISSGGTFAVNPGDSITLSGSGSISISGGALTQAYLYYVDADGDGYAPNATMYTNGASSVSGYVRVSSNRGTDCYDSNGNAHPGQTAYFTSSRGDGSYDYNCDGVATKNASSYVTSYTLSSPGSTGVCEPNYGCGVNCTGCEDEGSCSANMASTPSCGQSYTYISSESNNIGTTDCARLAGTSFDCNYYISCQTSQASTYVGCN